MDFRGILEDEPLRKEIEKRLGALRKRGRLPEKDAAAPEGFASPGGTSRSRAAEEAIVLSTGRPVLTVRKNTFEAPSSDVWTERLNKARSGLEKAILSVGRVELKNNPDYDWVGTAWIVAPGICVTNRHVAKTFAYRKNGSFVFQRHPMGTPMEARVDYRAEYLEPDEAEIAVSHVIYISDDEGPDVAFLALKEKGGRKPIPLASKVEAGQDVAAIGYPGWDGERNPGPDMPRIFNGLYEVKRLAPGRLTGATDRVITHDCSTLGGNSGSVILSLRKGEALGLHYSGSFHKGNYGVPAPIVKQLLEKHGGKA